MRKWVAVIACAVAPAAQADVTLGAFHDIERQLVILEANWYAKLPGRWASYGFIEAYKLPAQGFPPESDVLFGKTWVMRDVGRSFAVGLELEHGYNNAGMWTRDRPFQPNEFRILPKVGVTWRLQ